ncbi:hypothetical protein IFM89_029049 [Coptis chinensis]|uniref:Uncharacterized protein n=1 Tax=Coptis chinensis TaxID=261450 RepID=A0A835IIE5_9MAGN|nr:hypothetical protein IFM89_029049 [Coptis chinensis]
MEKGLEHGVGIRHCSFLEEAVLPRVILVGHSCGGASISYALECCPKKISKAIFILLLMVSDGKKPFDVFSEEKVEERLCSTPDGKRMVHLLEGLVRGPERLRENIKKNMAELFNFG